MRWGLKHLRIILGERCDLHSNIPTSHVLHIAAGPGQAGLGAFITAARIRAARARPPRSGVVSLLTYLGDCRRDGCYACSAQRAPHTSSPLLSSSLLSHRKNQRTAPSIIPRPSRDWTEERRQTNKNPPPRAGSLKNSRWRPLIGKAVKLFVVA